MMVEFDNTPEGAVPRIILIRGIPGSGKTTLARKLRAETASLIYEADDYFMEGDEYRFDPRFLTAAHDACFNGVAVSLDMGLSVIVSNTFTRNWEMARYLDLARENGYTIRVCRATGNFPNIHGVPESTVADMRERFEDFHFPE